MPINRLFYVSLLAVALVLPGGASAAALSVTPIETVEITSGTAGVAAFAILFEVTADADAYFSASSTSYGFSVHGPGVGAFISGLVSAAPKEGNDFVLAAGETERFTLVIASELTETGNYSARLNTLSYATEAGGATALYRISSTQSRFSTDDVYVAVGDVSAATGTIRTNSASVLTGTVKGADELFIKISDAAGKRVYQSMMTAKGGEWSHDIDADLPAGTYTVSLHEAESSRALATSALEVTDR